MAKIKEKLISVSRKDFELKVWPELEKELRAEMEEQSTPPGGAAPAGGLAMNFDSLVAVTVVQAILPDHIGAAPPAESVIREGGYKSVDDFISDIKPKLLSICTDPKDDKDKNELET